MKRLLIILAGLTVCMGLTAGVAMTKTQLAAKAPDEGDDHDPAPDARLPLLVAQQRRQPCLADDDACARRHDQVRRQRRDVPQAREDERSRRALRRQSGDAPHERVGQRHLRQGRHLPVHNEGWRGLPRHAREDDRRGQCPTPGRQGRVRAFRARSEGHRPLALRPARHHAWRRWPRLTPTPKRYVRPARST